MLGGGAADAGGTPGVAPTACEGPIFSVLGSSGSGRPTLASTRAPSAASSPGRKALGLRAVQPGERLERAAQLAVGLVPVAHQQGQRCARVAIAVECRRQPADLQHRQGPRAARPPAARRAHRARGRRRRFRRGGAPPAPPRRRVPGTRRRSGRDTRRHSRPRPRPRRAAVRAAHEPGHRATTSAGRPRWQDRASARRWRGRSRRVRACAGTAGAASAADRLWPPLAGQSGERR